MATIINTTSTTTTTSFAAAVVMEGRIAALQARSAKEVARRIAAGVDPITTGATGRVEAGEFAQGADCEALLAWAIPRRAEVVALKAAWDEAKTAATKAHEEAWAAGLAVLECELAALECQRPVSEQKASFCSETFSPEWRKEVAAKIAEAFCLSQENVELAMLNGDPAQTMRWALGFRHEDIVDYVSHISYVGYKKHMELWSLWKGFLNVLEEVSSYGRAAMWASEHLDLTRRHNLLMRDVYLSGDDWEMDVRGRKVHSSAMPLIGRLDHEVVNALFNGRDVLSDWGSTPDDGEVMISLSGEVFESSPGFLYGAWIKPRPVIQDWARKIMAAVWCRHEMVRLSEAYGRLVNINWDEAVRVGSLCFEMSRLEEEILKA